MGAVSELQPQGHLMHLVDIQIVVVMAIGVAVAVRVASILAARRAATLVPVRIRQRQHPET